LTGQDAAFGKHSKFLFGSLSFFFLGYHDDEIAIRSTEATLMIIQCPNCGFSGRIPRYAVTAPHLARCLRCRHQFEPGLLLPAGLQDDVAVSAPGKVLEGAGSGSEGDPGSSNYELEAITEDLATGIEELGSDPWGDEDEEPVMTSGPSFPKMASPREGPLGMTPLTYLRWAFRLMPGPADPWYSRVLQAWGIFFLFWAVAILARSLYYLMTAEKFATATQDIVWSVVSVILLVPGSAGLFLLVDLARYMRGLSRDEQDARDFADEPSGESATPPLRTWPEGPRALSAVRAANGR